MDNAAFRDLLGKAKGAEGEASRPVESSAAKAARLSKQAERKASYDKRMAVQAKRQEKLAEESKYVDRAAQRRKELAKAGVVEEAPMLAGLEELLEQPAVVVPDGPTFAQVGDGRDDLAQQQHRLSIEQSKFLGGDIEHTHLVKGLDFALLQKRRAELLTANAQQPAPKGGRPGAPAKPSKAPGGATAASAAAAAPEGGGGGAPVDLLSLPADGPSGAMARAIQVSRMRISAADEPTWRICIHVLLWHSHRSTSNVFRLV